MIEVSLNNVKHSVAIDQTLGDALTLWQFDNQHQFAVAVNQTFVPRNEYATYTLQEGDEIDIVQAISGG